MNTDRNIYRDEVDFPALAGQCPNFAKLLNYILWLQELLDTTGDGCRDAYESDREVVGLDM
ncbi:hypothetical protein GP486_003688 [Trichoglossum hirsutum]|uniref:Uncharacterized protein n=1 Tax=Trichoglossum hirsutum TaxID=265104 RepID=A0A9P8RQV0_9PEZI|nr:hypothetical protein GP486_003688 [Trichoglossum hirsutum]